MKNALEKLLDNMQKENQSNNALQGNDTNSAEDQAKIETLENEIEVLKKANGELFAMCQSFIIDDD